MKQTIRVSFDVPVDDHTFLKTECTKSRRSFGKLMQESFHRTVEEFKKKQLNDRLAQGMQEAKEGKGRIISQEELDSWAKMVDNE